MKIKVLILFFLMICISYSNNLRSQEYYSSYLSNQMLSKIDKNQIKFIIEVGAFDCKDSVMLWQYYQCPIVSFECSPLSIEKCKNTIKDYPYIKLVEKAIWEKTGSIDYHYCTTHPASSSCYLFDYESLAQINAQVPGLSTVKELEQVYPMQRVSVEAIRLDEWLSENKIDGIDLLCMDVQGAALNVLKSLGLYLKQVKYIIAEVEYRPGYQGEALFPEIKDYMQSNGFSCFYNLEYPAYFNDVLFIRNDLIKR